jgi:hypothetical protein
VKNERNESMTTGWLTKMTLKKYLYKKCVESGVNDDDDAKKEFYNIFYYSQ